MLSNKPYLIRAFYDWIVDSACTPFVLINALIRGCKVPEEFIENNQITLNVSPNAVRDFKITKDVLEFRASFSGVVHIISVPLKSVLAIYAQENQQGMFFDYEDDETEEGWSDTSTGQTADTLKTDKKRSHLRLVE
ncbi:MAG: ClpXP protease specificity-enhancing factor [uncultured bacterium]|nr:MAG: ClpXP protease specificity-enhancing factor [uncultured bacterium]